MINVIFRRCIFLFFANTHTLTVCYLLPQKVALSHNQSHSSCSLVVHSSFTSPNVKSLSPQSEALVHFSLMTQSHFLIYSEQVNKRAESISGLHMSSWTSENYWYVKVDFIVLSISYKCACSSRVAINILKLELVSVLCCNMYRFTKWQCVL